jgi:hypothetical protein
LTAIPTEEAPEPLQSTKYLYDGDGNMVKSVVNSTLGHTTTNYYSGKHYSVEEKGGVLKVQNVTRRSVVWPNPDPFDIY